MSIKTIDQSVRSNTEGVKKRINKSAEKMVFDILQSTQYSTPIPSTVRELVTNACDSQREKEMAIEILKGEKQESDYYIRRNEEQYVDSNFDPSYYNLDHLDTETNSITIEYHRNEGVGFCDKIRIIDHGVGIGSKRLEGVLELGYSTKRNTSQNFGAFGLGAKVALSTGVDFYTIETAHNGKRFKCSCYPYKTDFLIPKFNPSIEFSDGTKVHYEPTTEKNYTIIEFGVKKHNRNRFEEAITDQLNYLDNVNLFIIEDGDRREKGFQTRVIHNSKTMLVADSYMYSKPHIIIVKEPGADTGINYGHVDFRELEMQQLYGSVGLKCPMRQAIKDPDTGEEIVLQEGVEVTPSREKVIWNEHTKNFIQNVIIQAGNEATEMVEEHLQENDFLKWVQSCRDVMYKSSVISEDNALRQISQIIDTNKLSPKYPLDKSIKLIGPKSLLEGYSPKSVRQYVKAGKLHVESEDLVSWGNVKFDAIYLRKDVGRSRTKDLYLTDGGKTFVVLNGELLQKDVPEFTREQNPGYNKYLEESELLKSYDDIEVPEDWIDGLKTKEEAIENTDAMTGLSNAERRKVEQRIVAYTLRKNHRYQPYSGDHPMFIRDKVEPKLSTVMSSDRLTYYGTEADYEKLCLAAIMLSNQSLSIEQLVDGGVAYRVWDQDRGPSFYVDEFPKRLSYLDNTPNITVTSFDEDKLKMYSTPQLLKVSEGNVKYITRNNNCKHIDDFFCQWDAETNTISMDEHASNFLTGEIVEYLPEWLEKCTFIPGWGSLYETLNESKSNYYRVRKDNIPAQEMLDLCMRIKEFQEYADSVHNDSQLLAEKSRELFILQDVKIADAVDTEVVRLNKVKDEITDQIDVLMNQITFPYSNNSEFEEEITHYLKSRGKLEIVITKPQ